MNLMNWMTRRYHRSSSSSSSICIKQKNEWIHRKIRRNPFQIQKNQAKSVGSLLWFCNRKAFGNARNQWGSYASTLAWSLRYVFVIGCFLVRVIGWLNTKSHRRKFQYRIPFCFLYSFSSSWSSSLMVMWWRDVNLKKGLTQKDLVDGTGEEQGKNREEQGKNRDHNGFLFEQLNERGEYEEGDGFFLEGSA